MTTSRKYGLVLGASRSIGRAIAHTLADQGVILALPWYDWPEDSAAMIDQFAEKSHLHVCMHADLCNPEEIGKLVKNMEKAFGRLDILINNIERGGMPIIHGSYQRRVNVGQWQLEIETTLHAKWQVFEQCLPLLQKSDSANVINISSIAGIVGRSGPTSVLFNDGYSAANRGIRSLTETWARKCAPAIRVNELVLGIIDQRHGPGTRGWEELSTEQRQAIIEHTLLKRTGSVEDVVKAVEFILHSDFLTGASITLDGGYTLGGEEILPMPPGII
ncbi:SDR family NAD(P)-dependent oxidoreductase [Desulfogranum japonicum]|uniref:SDR family NAD(P)-dependent oxidoreductase n=1 Tax=Desulfogranum japonicum TaxID=231447 RepID=UPI0003FDF88B|nr:SDR family oxidoreductase [Desulfogranum japonicum]